MSIGGFSLKLGGERPIANAGKNPLIRRPHPAGCDQIVSIRRAISMRSTLASSLRLVPAMFNPPANITNHFRDRAAQRCLPMGVESFLRSWGTETWAAGATQITLVRNDLPPELRNTRLARRAEGWILVASASGALITCYRRRDAWHFIRRKRDCNARHRRARSR